MSRAPSGSGERLIHLISLIASEPDAFSISEFAERARLPLSSVHRLLKVLERSGMVERDAGQKYRAGRELQRIASLIVSRFDIARFAKPVLDSLSARFSETAALCVYSVPNRRGIISEVVSTPHPLRYAIDKGLEVSLPWGAIGRAILAYLPPSEIEIILRSETVSPLTGNPKPTREFLASELAAIRERGFAQFCDKNFGVAGVAAAIFRGKQEVLGSIGMMLPSQRFELYRHGDMGAAVRDAALELSSQAEICT
jgi:DNA-binding IclR family transcriptional regulator